MATVQAAKMAKSIMGNFLAVSRLDSNPIVNLKLKESPEEHAPIETDAGRLCLYTLSFAAEYLTEAHSMLDLPKEVSAQQSDQ